VSGGAQCATTLARLLIESEGSSGAGASEDRVDAPTKRVMDGTAFDELGELKLAVSSVLRVHPREEFLDEPALKSSYLLTGLIRVEPRQRCVGCFVPEADGRREPAAEFELRVSGACTHSA
jgi:hypothetical protein